MNTVGPILKGLSDKWNEYTSNSKHEEYAEFKGPVAGKNWQTRSLQIQVDEIDDEIDGYQKRFNSAPEYGDVINDNFARLTVLSFVERLIAVRQGAGSLKIGAGTSFANSNIAALNQIWQGNPFRNMFRGALLNFIQFSGVSVHALQYFWDKSLGAQLVYSSIFEIAIFPLDTIKTLIYNDLANEYKNVFDCIGKTVLDGGIQKLWAGVEMKLVYNAVFCWQIRNMYNESSEQLFSFPAWIISYGALTVKTRAQISGTRIAFHNHDGARKSLGKLGAYQGLIPFVLVNTLFSYQFYCLYGKEKREEILDHCREGYKEFETPFPTKNF